MGYGPTLRRCGGYAFTAEMCNGRSPTALLPAIRRHSQRVVNRKG